MEKAKNTPQEDITRQHYKGPSTTVAALGEGAMQTKFLMLGGLVVGGLTAFLMPKQSTKIVNFIQTHVSNARASENGLKRLAGTFGKFTLDFGKEMADLVQKIGFIKSGLLKFDKERIAAAVDGAVLTAGAASILGAFSGGGAGIASARAGRKQFDTAKEEILTLRQKVAQQNSEIEDLKTADAAKKGILKVSAEDIKPDASPLKTAGTETKQEAPVTASEKAMPETAAEKSEAADKTSHAATLGAKPQTWTDDISMQSAAKADAQLAL